MNNENVGSRYIVRTENKNSREQLISFLENEGYRSKVDETTNRQIVLDSIFPIVVDTDNATYDSLHSTTSAAAAVSSHAVICEDEFYVLFKGSHR